MRITPQEANDLIATIKSNLTQISEAVAALKAGFPNCDKFPDLESDFRALERSASRSFSEVEAYMEDHVQNTREFVLHYTRQRSGDDFFYTGTLREPSAEVGRRNVGGDAKFTLPALIEWAEQQAFLKHGQVIHVTSEAIPLDLGLADAEAQEKVA